MAQNVQPSTGSPLQSCSINADVVNLEDVIEEQIGGGHHLPSPPPQLTLTQFHTHDLFLRHKHVMSICSTSPNLTEHSMMTKTHSKKVDRREESSRGAAVKVSGDYGWPVSVGCSSFEHLENSTATSFMQISLQHKPESIHSESVLLLQSVIPVSQADGNHKSDEDTPHQKVVSDGSLTVWPDSTISFGESGSTDFDFNDNIGHPETPLPSNHGESIQSGPMLVTEDNAKGQLTATDEPACVVGRTTASMAAILEDGFEHINNEFNTLSGCIRMPIQQVIQCFTQQYACSNSTNEWNAYQQYFTAHRAQELQRLPGADKMSKCYKLFCKQFLDTYKQILVVYNDTVVLGNGDKAVAQHQQLFYSMSKQFVQLFNSVANCHVFEGAFLLAGSVINQDGSIGYMHTTPSTKNYSSRSSLAIIAEAFDGSNQPHDLSGMKDQSNKHTHHTSSTDGANNAGPSKMKGSSSAKDGEIHVWLSRALWIQRSRSGSKGISDLILAECRTLIAALTDKSKHGLCFMVKPDMYDALYYSWSPVIYGAPLDSDSKHASAKRMYANLKCDHLGTAQKSSVAATHLKKKTSGKSTHDVKVISIPDSDEIIPDPAPQTKAKCHPSSAPNSDKVEEIPLVIRKSTQLQPRKPTRQVVKSEDDDNDSINMDSEYNPDDKVSINDGSSTEGVMIEDEDSVLEDEGQLSSCMHKHKHTFDDTGHASKRLANNTKPVRPLSISPVPLSYKGKGKSLDIATNRAVGKEDDVSADEGQERLAISPMPVKSPPANPATSSSKDKENKQNITTNKTTDMPPHAQPGQDAPKANHSCLHTILMTPLPPPNEDGHTEAPTSAKPWVWCRGTDPQMVQIFHRPSTDP
ncbi:hypothetical protein EDD16DRAFT_1519579 [Pisolithus croceorrhizus]|nr:hypothetical protein EDD16DRAFT_1519579 [Pisolithus croceorrhizus]